VVDSGPKLQPLPDLTEEVKEPLKEDDYLI
jgi:hypothetical protein